MIKQKELIQLVRWTGLWIFSFFVALNLREIIIDRFPNPLHQIIIGIIGLLIWAYIFDLTKYSG